MIVYIAIAVLVIAGWWMIFVKANEEGWKAIIPIDNVYVLLKIVGREGWSLILFLIPIVSFVVWVIVSLDLAKSFGKSGAFAVGLIFLLHPDPAPALHVVAWQHVSEMPICRGFSCLANGS